MMMMMMITWSCTLQVSALDQELIEVDPDTKEMLKLLVSLRYALCVCVCGPVREGTPPHPMYLKHYLIVLLFICFYLIYLLIFPLFLICYICLI